MSYKRLTPCIFIAGGKAVRWFDDRTVLTEDVIALAKQYNANGADELLVFDLSDSDEDHEESIDLIKKINRIISIPMVSMKWIVDTSGYPDVETKIGKDYFDFIVQIRK